MFKFFKKKKKEPENFGEILAYFRNLEKSFEKLSEGLENLKKDALFVLERLKLEKEVLKKREVLQQDVVGRYLV